VFIIDMLDGNRGRWACFQIFVDAMMSVVLGRGTKHPPHQLQGSPGIWQSTVSSPMGCMAANAFLGTKKPGKCM